MTGPAPRDANAIHAWHAHVYFDPDNRAPALALREQVAARFPAATLGRWHAVPVGPHPRAMFQIAFAPALFPALVPFLALNRAGMAVLVHPETGRPSLYLGRRPNAWIVGLSDADSEALLDELWAHVEKGPFVWAQEWLKGDLVIWDNRCTLHRRNTLDPSLRRLMHRTQVRDSARPVAA